MHRRYEEHRAFRRPVPEGPNAVRCIYHCYSLLICGVVVTIEGITQPWMRSPLITAVILEQLDSQDEKTQTTAVPGACKMLLLHIIDSADVSGSLSFAFGRKIKLNLDSQLLAALTLLFFAPDTLSNVALRQFLSTFFHRSPFRHQQTCPCPDFAAPFRHAICGFPTLVAEASPSDMSRA